MKKLSIISLVVILSLAFTTAALASTEIKVWFHSGRGAERDVIKDQVKRFNEMQDEVEAKLVQIPEGSYTQQVQSAAAAGDLPDVLDLDGPTIANYAWSEYLTPLEDYISSDLEEDLLPSIKKQGEYNGHFYALGTFDAGLGIWANKKYLNKIDARIPKKAENAWTFPEFMNILKRLKELDEVEYPLDFKLNYGVGEWYTYGFAPIFWGFGADLVDLDEMAAEGEINGPAANAAAAWFQSLFEKGYANPNPPGDTEFTSGKAALSWCGHWVYNQNKDALGDNLVLLPLPKFASHVTGMGSWAWSIPKNSDNPDAAWKFIKFLMRPEEIVKMTDANGAIPSRKSAMEMTDKYKEGGELQVFVEQLETIARPRPVTPVYPTITSAFQTALDNIISGSDVSEELNEAAKTIEEEMGYMGLK